MKRVLGSDVWMLTYNQENQLKQLHNTTRGVTSAIADHVYDVDGVRVSSRVTKTTTVTTHYVVNDFERVV